MGTLNKYIFKEVLLAIFMTVALFVFVLVLGNVVKIVMGDLLAGRLSLSFFGYIIMLLIPSVIPYALPLGMLTGILLVFGRLSSQGEIVAMKASGRSLLSMSAPVFFIAICASIFSIGINFYYAPMASHAYKTALKNLIRDNPLQFINPGTFVREFPGYVIYANSSEDNILKGFRIWELNKDGQVQVSIQSDTGKLTYDETKDEINLMLNNGTAERSRQDDPENLRKPLSIARFDELLIKLPLNEIMGGFDNKKRKLSLMTLGELMNVRETWRGGWGIDHEITPEEALKFRVEVLLQIQKNFAMAFSIFSMVLLAVPLAIKVSRSETLANVAIAIALAMTYYLATVIISWLEKYPSIRPDILIWIPNLLFQAIGLILIYRASKN